MSAKTYMITEVQDANDQIQIFRRYGPRAPLEQLHATAGGLSWESEAPGSRAPAVVYASEPRPADERDEIEIAGFSAYRPAATRPPSPHTGGTRAATASPAGTENPLTAEFNAKIYQRRKLEAASHAASTGDLEGGTEGPSSGEAGLDVYEWRRREVAESRRGAESIR